MKEYTFPYYISFGKNDSIDCEVTISLSNKNAERLERSAKTKPRFRLDEDEDIWDIYDKVYDAIIKQEKEELLIDFTPVRDALSWTDDYDKDTLITEEQIDNYLDNLNRGINYPDVLQGLEPTIKPKSKKSESIIIERPNGQKHLWDMALDLTKIIYFDGGQTLYRVPCDYSGVFTVKATVKTIEGTAFNFCDRIKEIIIEDGITEIPDNAFSRCENLEKITIPKTVIKIGFNAFTRCYHLKEVVLSEGLVEIDNTAFRFCDSLKELHIPSTVKKISMHIDSYSNGLKDLYFHGMETQIDNHMHSDEWGITLHVMDGSWAEAFAIKHNYTYMIIE